MRSFGRAPIPVELVTEFNCDFADIFEVRGVRRREHGNIIAERTDRQGTTVAYHGLDGVARRCRIEFSTPADLPIFPGSALRSVAMESLRNWLRPDPARAVLAFLAATQAETFDRSVDAEPGKILHEARRGEMAILREVPFHRYYGSVDATPLFVMLAVAYWDRTGDWEFMRELWPNIQAALAWMLNHGDRDGDGFIEYARHTEAGLLNQDWKDSSASIFHADGRPAEPPIALVEVQAYAYAAWSGAARLAASLGHHDEQVAFADHAESLRQRFEETFWCPELGSYALALDKAKRPCRVRASNAGYVLFCGLAAPERACAVANTLMSPSGFSGWEAERLLRERRATTRYRITTGPCGRTTTLWSPWGLPDMV